MLLNDMIVSLVYFCNTVIVENLLCNVFLSHLQCDGSCGECFSCFTLSCFVVAPNPESHSSQIDLTLFFFFLAKRKRKNSSLLLHSVEELL